MGVAVTTAMLTVAGCGGVAELDSGEVETVNQARSAVSEARASGTLKPGDGDTLTEFMILCREKPLSEVEGDTLRETMDELAPQLKGIDREYFRKMDRLATNGCD
ncbi:MAG: hypothetical protein H6532_06145 [Thermoleophilales bacterium]|nr:hypothetical protein [Thermoleophilales bacterium]